MPEGHTIHRQARLQREKFVGEPLRVSSPQGRFAEGAGLLDGHALTDIDAWGKHLFYEWSNGALLHIHLGLFGRFRHHVSDPPPPTDGTRLAMGGSKGVLYLSGPTACDIVDPEEREAIIGGLGPDPLRASEAVDPVAHVTEYLGRRTVPIAASLLDQSVIAGIGNVYRSEILFRRGIHPMIESRRITEAEAGGIWEEATRQLRAGERSGRIVTTSPEDVGRERRSQIKPGERTYV
jgi:endonuclease-8